MVRCATSNCIHHCLVHLVYWLSFFSAASFSAFSLQYWSKPGFKMYRPATMPAPSSRRICHRGVPAGLFTRGAMVELRVYCLNIDIWINIQSLYEISVLIRAIHVARHVSQWYQGIWNVSAMHYALVWFGVCLWQYLRKVTYLYRLCIELDEKQG